MARKVLYENEIVRMAALAGDAAYIDGITFQGCDIKGPAVLLFRGEGDLLDSTFTGDPESIFWEFPTTRDRIIGAILVTNCRFIACTFLNIGIAGTPDEIGKYRTGLQPPT